MSWYKVNFKDKVNTHLGTKIMTIGLIGLVSAVLLYWGIVNNMAQDNEITLTAEGMEVNVKATISPFDRHNLPSPPSEIYEGMLYPSSASPQSAGSPTPTKFYYENFEANDVDWVSTNIKQRISSPKRDIYEGHYSEKNIPNNVNKQGNLTLNKIIELNENDSTDIMWFTKISGDMPNVLDFYLVQFDVVWEGSEAVRITYLMKNGASGYSSSNPREIILQGSLTPNIYMGFMITDVRNKTANIDESIIDMPMNITNFKFRIHSEKGRSFLIDAISMIKTSAQYINIWYDAEDNAVTDYQLTLNYTIYLDSSQIENVSQFVFLFELNNTIVGSLETIPNFFIEAVILTELDFESNENGRFDLKIEGSIVGIIHDLPLFDYWGSEMEYQFNYYAKAYAPLKNGMSTMAEKTGDLTSQNFAVEYKSPLAI